MSLRKKILIVIGMTLVIALVLVYTAAQVILLDSYREIEQQAIDDDLARVSRLIQRDIETMSAWAAQTPAASAVVVFDSGVADALLFLDGDGQVADSTAAEDITPPDELDPLPGADGLLVNGDTVWMLAFGPDDAIIWLKAVDQAALSTLLDRSVTIAPPGGSLVTSFGDDRIQANTQLEDVYGQPVVTAQIETTRQVFDQSRDNLTYLVGVVVLVSLGFSITIALLLERLILKRLAGLSRTVRTIGQNRDLSTRARISGHDEITNLSGALNNMLRAIEDAQADLRRSEKQLSSVVTRVPVILFAVDSEGVFTLVEGKDLELLKVTGPDVLGKSVYELYENNEQIITNTRRVLGGGAFKDIFEFEETVFDVWYTPMIEEDGSVSGAIGVAVNITEQKQTEDALRSAKEAAESANQAKNTFLANMTHELRTPLNSIIGFTDVMLINKKLDEKNIHRAGRIRSNGERLLELIDDILDLSRIEAGRMVLIPNDVHVRGLLSTMQTHTEQEAQAKGLEFIYDIAPEVPETICIDQDALMKIISHLLTNAVKFTESGHVTFRLNTEADQLIIRVEDTGIGIPAYMHEVIFQSFRQVDGSATREYGGTGLGLAIVYHLCVAMGGTVSLESEVDKGSIFTVKLPLVSDNNKVEAERNGDLLDES